MRTTNQEYRTEATVLAVAVEMAKNSWKVGLDDGYQRRPRVKRCDDSQMLLAVVLAGDSRLPQRLGRDELLPLGSRIRIRLNTEYADTEQLMAALRHLLEVVDPQLMTEGLMTTLVEHAAGNYRVMTTLAAELLATAARTQRDTLDEQLYFECFNPTPSARKGA